MLHAIPLRKILDAPGWTAYSKSDHNNISISTCSSSKLSLSHQEVKSLSPPLDLKQLITASINRMYESHAAEGQRLGHKRWQRSILCVLWKVIPSLSLEPPYKKSIYYEATKPERLCGETKQRYRDMSEGPQLLQMLCPPTFSAQVPDMWVNNPLWWPQPQAPPDCNLITDWSKTAPQNCSWISDLQKMWDNKQLFFF